MEKWDVLRGKRIIRCFGRVILRLRRIILRHPGTTLRRGGNRLPGGMIVRECSWADEEDRRVA